MFNNLTALGVTLVTFAITIVIGIVVVSELGDSVGGTGNTTAQYVVTQLGSGGLAGWIPAIIALAVGMLFLGALAMFKGRSY